MSQRRRISYHRDGPDCKDDFVTRRSRLSDRRIINDINACVGFLQRHEAVDRGRIGIIGFCMGGRVVYLMAPPIRFSKRRWPIMAVIFSRLGP